MIKELYFSYPIFTLTVFATRDWFFKGSQEIDLFNSFYLIESVMQIFLILFLLLPLTRHNLDLRTSNCRRTDKDKETVVHRRVCYQLRERHASSLIA